MISVIVSSGSGLILRISGTLFIKVLDARNEVMRYASTRMHEKSELYS